MIPHLLLIVEGVISDPDTYIDEPSRIGHLYALYLLAQFRETRLYPLLIKLLSLPADMIDAILGDCVTEGVGRMLASVCTDDLLPIQQLIENEENDEFVRGQGLHALVILVVHGKLDRKWTINYFRELLTEKISDKYPYFNAHIISSIADLHPKEAYEDIKCAYEKSAVDSMMINLDDINRIMNMSKDSVIDKSRNDHQFQYIEDTISELEWWACFQQKKNLSPAKSVRNVLGSTNRKTNPAIKVEKIGRNDPCTMRQWSKVQEMLREVKSEYE